MSFAFVAFTLMIATCPRVHGDDTSAETFIRGLFASFSWTATEMRDPLEGDDRGRLLEAGLVSLLDRYAHVSTGPGISISLCDCQEGPVSDLQLRVDENSSNSAIVEAKFNAGGSPRVLRYLLQKREVAGGGSLPMFRIGLIQPILGALGAGSL